MTAGPREIHLLRCRSCDARSVPLPLPFDTQKERGEWARDHSNATGHFEYKVWTEQR